MLAEAGVTKGALYHHFGSKKGLGFAVIDEVVRDMVLTWRQGLAEGLARGQRNGTVRADVDPEDAATFLVAACEGTIGLAKSAQSVGHLEACIQGLVHYLGSLRPQAVPAAASAAAEAARKSGFRPPRENLLPPEPKTTTERNRPMAHMKRPVFFLVLQSAMSDRDQPERAWRDLQGGSSRLSLPSDGAR